ncbi:MAG: hypothetical protein D6714_14210 [Bacteroidetes bacterium]|nr:MAG: hypothetical protein D6714_14210 [Bacteroidota bacterium]
MGEKIFPAFDFGQASSPACAICLFPGGVSSEKERRRDSPLQSAEPPPPLSFERNPRRQRPQGQHLWHWLKTHRTGHFFPKKHKARTACREHCIARFWRHCAAAGNHLSAPMLGIPFYQPFRLTLHNILKYDTSDG